MKKTLFIVVSSLTLAGCYRSQIVAPADKNFVLATRGDFCQEVDTRKVYSFLGLANYNENTPNTILADVPAGKKVRFKTRQSFVDLLVGSLTFGLISMHSIQAEVCQ